MDVILELVTTNVLTRWDCDICGGHTEKVSTLCEGVTAESREVRACETCLRAGQEQIDARLQKNIARYEPRVTFLRSLIGRVKVPTYAEWEASEESAWPSDEPDPSPFARSLVDSDLDGPFPF
jgi:hypothetical protein